MIDPEHQRQINIRSARGWRPTPGETIVGTVAHLGRRESEYGDFPVVTLAADTDDPEATNYVAVNAFHTILKKQLFEIKPKVGDRLSVTYHGKVQPDKPGANAYHHYTALNPDAPVADEEFSWDEDAGF